MAGFLQRLSAVRRRRGFTAAELSAVAAIIAILVLIAVPIFRDRVDEARRVGTLDDMQGMAKALVLANADTAFYPRLQDLDNGILIDPASPGAPVDPSTEIPIGNNNRVFSPSERLALQNQWKGPYAAIQNTQTIGQIQALGASFLSTNNGPIRVFTPIATSTPVGSLNDFAGDRYPVDHYGTPYVYFPPGRYIINPNSPQGNETNFSGGIIYSLGPNALPGDGSQGLGGPANPAANSLRRESGILGTDDDLQYFF